MQMNKVVPTMFKLDPCKFNGDMCLLGELTNGRKF